MIDINELRRKLRSDDLIDHIDIHANVKSTLAELMDRLEAAEKSDAESIRMYRKARDERDELLEALREIMPFTATIAIGCHGDKCREPWCYSCNSEEEAEEAARKGRDAWAKARAAISRHHG